MLTLKENLMKNRIINKLLTVVFCVFLLLTALVSCEKDDVFSGSPVGSDLNFITLRGSVTTVENEVVGGQSFPVTISLGDNVETPEADLLTFPIDVNVEVIALVPTLNKRTRRSFVIPAGENSIEATMAAPSGDATTTLPFDFELKLYLSAITSGQDEEVRGFSGKQYSMVSDTLTLGYGDTGLSALNTKRCAVRFDFEGPYSGASAGGFNNLDLVFKKNGAPFKVAGSGSTTRPVYGTLTTNPRYEVINFMDEEQDYEVQNVSLSDSIAGIYTIKSPNGTGANDRPHGFKVGDEVRLEAINGSSSTPLIAQISTLADPYTCTFSFSGTHLFEGLGSSFYQPVIVPRKLNFVPQAWIPSAAYAVNTPVTYNSVTYYALVNITAGSSASNQLPNLANSLVWTNVQPNESWSPFLAYSGNESVVVNSVTYYAIRNVAVNPAGNVIPSLDPVNWTTVKPKINWSTAFLNPPTWVAGTTGAPKTYNVNDVFIFNGVVYVCTKQHTITSGTPTPANDASRWTTAIVKYKSEVLHYTATDTFTIETFARSLRVSPSDLRYKFAIRFPDGKSKIYSGTYSGLTVQPAANAVLKLSVVRTIVQGASTYEFTHFE